MLMRQPQLAARIKELQNEGMSFKDAYEKALFERDQLPLI